MLVWCFLPCAQTWDCERETHAVPGSLTSSGFCRTTADAEQTDLFPPVVPQDIHVLSVSVCHFFPSFPSGQSRFPPSTALLGSLAFTTTQWVMLASIQRAPRTSPPQLGCGGLSLLCLQHCWGFPVASELGFD